MNTDSNEESSINYASMPMRTKSNKKCLYWLRSKFNEMIRPTAGKIIVVVLVLAFVFVAVSWKTEDNEAEEVEKCYTVKWRRGPVYRFFSPIESYLSSQEKCIPKRTRRGYKAVPSWFVQQIWNYYQLAGGGLGVGVQIIVCLLSFVVYQKCRATKYPEECDNEDSESDYTVMEVTPLEDSVTSESSSSDENVRNMPVKRCPAAFLHRMRSIAQHDAPLQNLPSCRLRRASHPMRVSTPSPALLRAVSLPNSMFIGSRARARADELPGNIDHLLRVMPIVSKTETYLTEGCASSESTYPASSFGTNASNASGHRHWQN